MMEEEMLVAIAEEYGYSPDTIKKMFDFRLLGIKPKIDFGC